MEPPNNSNKQEHKINYCRICARNGFANEPIIFKSEGVKSDGSKLWVLYNYDSQSERHIHKRRRQGEENNTTTNREQTNEAQCQVQQYLDTIGPVVAKNLDLSEESKTLLLTLIDMVKKISKAMAV